MRQQKSEFLKCECGSTNFRVQILANSALLFICAEEKCEKTIHLDVPPNADNITKMAMGYLSDKAKAKIVDIFLNHGKDNA